MVTQKIMFLLLACSIALPLYTMEAPDNPEEKQTEESAHHTCKLRINNNTQIQHLDNNDETPNDENFSLFCFATVTTYAVISAIVWFLCDNNTSFPPE